MKLYCFLRSFFLRKIKKLEKAQHNQGLILFLQKNVFNFVQVLEVNNENVKKLVYVNV